MCFSAPPYTMAVLMQRFSVFSWAEIKKPCEVSGRQQVNSKKEENTKTDWDKLEQKKQVNKKEELRGGGGGRERMHLAQEEQQTTRFYDGQLRPTSLLLVNLNSSWMYHYGVQCQLTSGKLQ